MICTCIHKSQLGDNITRMVKSTQFTKEQRAHNPTHTRKQRQHNSRYKEYKDNTTHTRVQRQSTIVTRLTLEYKDNPAEMTVQ